MDQPKTPASSATRPINVLAQHFNCRTSDSYQLLTAMEMRILDPKGDIIFVLKSPNQQRILTEAAIQWPTKSSKKKIGHSSQVSFESFNENPFQTPAVDVNATLLSIDPSAVTSASDESDRLFAGANADDTTIIDSESLCFGKPKEIRFRASSSHLRLASPILEGMLDGKYPENSLEKIITAEDGSECRLLYTSEWDEKVFLILMNWIHGRHREVPKQVDLEMLGKFAILVDYYKCPRDYGYARGNLDQQA
ncbi:hypothetical protein PWT90_06456 [Aphanocladium album]|nr:hypothetical protein PWT90_06456 [Aphanocladium album]